MAKTDLGTKRACLSCGVKFYDLGKSPTVCPSCGHEAKPEAFQARRPNETPKPVEAPKAKDQKPAKKVDEDIEDDLIEDEDDEAVLDDDLDDDDEIDVDVGVDEDDEK